MIKATDNNSEAISDLKTTRLAKDGTQIQFDSNEKCDPNTYTSGSTIPIRDATKATLKYTGTGDSDKHYCFRISGGSSSDLCVSTAGFAYEGTCVF